MDECVTTRGFSLVVGQCYQEGFIRRGFWGSDRGRMQWIIGKDGTGSDDRIRELITVIFSSV